MFGWNGTILRADLTKGKILKQPLEKRTAQDFFYFSSFFRRTFGGEESEIGYLDSKILH